MLRERKPLGQPAMVRRTRLSTVTLIIACSGCGGSDTEHDSAGNAGGGSTHITSVPCDSEFGCVRADVAFDLQCTAPDDGSGVTSWIANVAPEAAGGCALSSGALALSIGDVNASSVTLVFPFSGGGIYHLGALGGGEQLNIHGQGFRGDPNGITDADTNEPCSAGCELDVLPHGQMLVVNDWVTYRFVVTCADPLGMDDCGQCTMAPSSFQMEAACFSAPEP